MAKLLTVFRTLAFVGVFALIASAAQSAEPYEIDAILSLTGTAAFIGQDEAAGLQLVETTVNRTGGIGGRDVHFVVNDDQSSPEVAVQLFNQIAAKKPAVVLGTTLVAGCNALLPLTLQGPVLYCLSSSFNPPPGAYAIAYGITTANKMRVNLNYYRLRGFRKIAAIATSDATGQEGERGIRAALAAPENASMQLVDFEHFNASDVTIAAEMSRIKAAAPDAIIAYVSGTPLGTILRGALQVGLDVPIAVPGSNFNPKVVDQFASILPAAGLYIAIEPHFTPDNLPGGAMRRSVSTYLNATKEPGARGGAQTMLSWDAANVIIGALRAIGPNASAEQLKNYIAGLHGWYGACCEYDFRGNSHGLTAKDGVVVRYDTAKKAFVPVSRIGTGVPIPGV